MSDDKTEPSIWNASLLGCVSCVLVFLLVVCVVEWQFNKVHHQMEQLRLGVIRDLDRENLLRIMNEDQRNES